MTTGNGIIFAAGQNRKELEMCEARMKTVTICGSMRFEKEMQRIAFELETRHNMNVLQCVYNICHKSVSEAERDALSRAHYRKIEISDAIFVVDIQGYIGAAASEEIRFAREKGKEIILYSEYNL